MKSFKRFIAIVLSLSLINLSIGSAQAAMIANDQVINQVQQINSKAELLQLMNRADVHQQLLDMGVSTEDIEARINMMTDQEIAQLNQQLGDLPAGGDALGIILVIFIVFVITDMLGATDIFPFIHKVD